MHLVTAQSDESIFRAKAQMHQERIEAGLCPACEPIRILDEFGFCSNPFCAFAAFAGPCSPNTITDPRR
jgi:hypothetical protein